MTAWKRLHCCPLGELKCIKCNEGLDGVYWRHGKDTVCIKCFKGVEMTAEEKLKELEEKGITCSDCEKLDICRLPKEPICFSYKNRPNS